MAGDVKEILLFKPARIVAVESIKIFSHQMSDIITEIELFVKAAMKNNDPSHDWLHVDRVRNQALFLAHRLNNTIKTIPLKKEEILSNNFAHLLSSYDEASLCKIDLLVVEVAALLHDIIDPKYFSGTVKDALTVINSLLLDKMSIIQKDSIIEVILNMSFRKELCNPDYFKNLFNLKTDGNVSHALAFACVQDADRLDALGAIGIARCFAYGSINYTPFYSIGQGPQLQLTAEEYASKQQTGIINHFYEKLFKLCNLIKTAPGESLAEARTKFMKEFVDNFHMEAGIDLC